jgi:3-oxoacyl-[acyl-carrier-protein] synthase-3
MAFLEVKNVRIAGISAGVPKDIVVNEGSVVQSEDYDASAFVETTGVGQRRISDTLTTSDLAYHAAEQLIHDLTWKKEDIDALIFLSQFPDYFLPATSCILQDRLGLKTECYTLDISLGCSGWVYGMSVVVSLLQSGCFKKALLLVGDAKRIIEAHKDPLFGYAACATALEYQEGAHGFQFHFGTDGSGFDAIIIPDGGARNQINCQSFEYATIDGKKYNRLMERMNGMDVFSFGISTAPKSVKKLAEYFEFDYQEADYYVFHQANMKMNKMIQKKLKLDDEKVPYSLRDFGNTSSASIPITIVTQLKNQLKNKTTKFICCGFGVGLSWGSVRFTTDEHVVISELVEVNNEQIDTVHVV